MGINPLTVLDTSDGYFMERALQLAQRARQANEVPVGAVLVLHDRIIGSGWNQPIGTHDPTAHAEIGALREAALAMRNYRLVDSRLFVTLEPCVMCLGAMIHARVGRLVFGAFRAPNHTLSIDAVMVGQNHRIDWQGGVLAEQSGRLLKDFFNARRLSE